MDKIQELKAQLETLGCTVIIWVDGDFDEVDDDGNIVNMRSNLMHNIFREDLEEICTVAGSEAISQWQQTALF